jgi:hypothetical protein
MKKGPTPVDFGVTHDEEVVDPSPLVSTVTEKSPHDNWTECWDKFYINKNDDWKKMSNILREFCITVHAELNSLSEDVVPPSPPTATSSSNLIKSGRATLQPEVSVITKKRKGGKGEKGENLKKNKKSKVVEEEEIVCSEVNYRIFFFFKNVEILIVTIFFSKIQ